MARLATELDPIRDAFVSPEQAVQLRKLYEEHNAWAQQFKQKNGWVVIPAEASAACPCPMSNEQRGKLEQFEFYAEMPDRYFGYVNEKEKTFTTWTGDYLGRVVFGREFRDNFGGRRVSIDVHCLNGTRYFGTYYKSAGDYARIRKAKRQGQAATASREGLRPQDLAAVEPEQPKPTSRDALRRRAKASAEARGHSIKWGKPYKNGTLQMGECRNGLCGKAAFIITKPEANETHITGEAVATRCLYNPASTY